MAKKAIEVRNLTFTYSGSDEPALEDVSFDVGDGEILLVIGQSGCGKTTLLQHLKTSYLPEGKRTSSSKIRIDGTLIEDMSEEDQAFKVGYVGQQVEASQVTDKVWHELAFGLESLSKPESYIRRRVCEVAAFFGLEQVFHSKLSELSGGQKQLVNLASVMIMEPEILVLDEPTSQLDPMSAEEFFRMTRKVHDELGTTIVIAEHRLESIYGDADNVMVLNDGRLLTCGTPGEVSEFLHEKGMSLFRSLPVSVRLYYDVYFQNSNSTESDISDTDADGYDESYEKHKAPPLTVNSGRTFLKSLVEDGEFLEGTALEKRIVNEDATIENATIENASAENASIKRIKSIKDETVLVAEEIWFRYKKNSRDILKACSFMLPKGKITALLGGNGAGKSTLLYVLAGYLSPYIGRVKSYDVKIGVLPQEPKSMFAKKTVAEELGIFVNKKVNEVNNSEDHVEKSRTEKIAEFFDLSDCLMKHPFDLSGGQQQKLAMAKLVLGDYDIFLLDEPGKGMDYAFKEKMGIYLKELADKGKTILTVSHDVEFAAAYADYCGLFFDGNVVSLEDTRAFFSQNVFYTTAVRRMSRKIVDAVIYKELLGYFGEKSENAGMISCDKDDSENTGKISCAESDSENTAKLLSEKEDNDQLYKLIEDISEENSGGKEYADASDNDIETNGKQNIEESNEYTGEDKEHLTLRRLIIPALVFFLLMPLTIYLGHSVLHQRKYYFISLMLILEGIGAFMIGFERGKPKLKEIMTIAVMSAITALSRAAFYMIPAVKPMAALTIISGIGLGAVPGFLVGALSMLVSDIFFGQGPWTPWQMFTMGLIGFLAGAVFRRKREFDKKRRIDITVFGLLIVFFVYGGIMNPASVLMYQENVSWEMLLASYAPGIPIDAIHAISTAVFLWLGAGTMLEKIERVRKK